MRTLLLKFAGPLQSWGTASDFEIRHTDLYPSKSAVIGLIAASLGYRRNDDERNQKLNKLDFEKIFEYANKTNNLKAIKKLYELGRDDNR